MSPLSWILLILLVLAVAYIFTCGSGSGRFETTGMGGPTALPTKKAEDPQAKSRHKQHGGCCLGQVT